MPTHAEEPAFLREYARLTPQQRRRFLAAVDAMVEDLRAGKPFRKSLRIGMLSGHPGIYEMTWEMPDGRATFHYGTSPHPDDVHVVWRRIGGHEIYKQP